MAQTATALLSSNSIIPDGSAVGIVHFDTDAETKAAITVIESQADRDSLLLAVPTEADGASTSIGDGLAKCRQVNFGFM